MPSIVKLVPAGESTTANVGGLIPSRPRTVLATEISRSRHQEQMGRGVYEQNCQFCHGPELKGDRGPALDTVVSRLGAETTRNTITNGRATMPAFSSLAASSMNDLMAFLKQPDLAPLGSAPTAATQSHDEVSGGATLPG